MFSYAVAIVMEHQLREKLWAAMPPDMASESRREYRQNMEKLEEHRRALEIANASRPRNVIETILGIK